MFQIRTTRLRAAMAAALVSLTLAAPALADRDRWDDDDRRGYRVHRHDRRCDHDDRHGRDWRSHWGHERRWDGGRRDWDRGHRDWDRGHRRYRDHDYGCRPCGRRWRSERDFHRHLRGHHHVSVPAIPRVLVAVDGGWLFRG
jgi:hypothetical protein